MSECGKILVCHPFEESACPRAGITHDTFFLCVGSAVIRAVADGIFSSEINGLEKVEGIG